MNEFERAKSLVAFETERAFVSTLARQIEAVPRWIPSAGLREYIVRNERMLADARQRLEAKPVIAIVGPNGAGKSTLANAISGADGLATVGKDRPTTRKVTVISRTVDDARQLLEQIAHQDIDMFSCTSTLLPNAIVVDTPDTNSAECLIHRHLVERVLELSDVMLCVFDGSNPKMRDNIEVLADWVNAFPGEEVYLILNRCDRIPETQLRADVLPDFLKHIAHSWNRKFDEVFCVSARGGLQEPQWPENESPLHQHNELGQLRDRLKMLGGGALFLDRRVDRARHLRATSIDVIKDAIRCKAADLPATRSKIADLEREIAQKGVESVSREMGHDPGGVTALLCGAMAQRWGGPVGVFLAIWRRLVDVWTPYSLFRLINPIMLPFLVIRGLRVLQNPEKFEKEFEKRLTSLSPQIQNVEARMIAAREWPSLAEQLIACGFDPGLRDMDAALDLEPLSGLSQQVWGESVQKAVNIAADRLSRSWCQWILNAPSILGLMVATAAFLYWPIVHKSFLPSEFYAHCIGLLLLLWLMPSGFLQFLALRSRSSIPHMALAHAKKATSETLEGRTTKEGILAEIDMVMQLGRTSGADLGEPSEYL